VSADLSGKRVLVAEDELLVAMLIEEILDQFECQLVGPFATVANALAAARNATDIDIALLDVNLRGQKIYPVAEALDERGIPFVLVSGYGKGAVPPNRPHWNVCPKPFDADDLGKMLTATLQGRR
jgi:CheY-like chemotaxis protein